MEDLTSFNNNVIIFLCQTCILVKIFSLSVWMESGELYNFQAPLCIFCCVYVQTMI